MSLPGSLQVSPQAHDIVFSFRDSCNCCRSCKTADDRMYINSHGGVERFKVSKANGSPAQAFERAMKHLNATMERHLETFDGDPDIFARKVDRIFQSINALQEINRSHLEAINDLMLEYFHEKQSGVRHVRFEDRVQPPQLMEPQRIDGSRCVIL